MFFSIDKISVIELFHHQASCGSCAVFAAVATIDTCMWQVTGHLEDDLSEQHLMDCAYGWGYGNAGCDGGFVVSYMDWVVEGNNGYMEKESCAPYYASDMTCNDDDSCNYDQATVTGYYNNWSPDEDELKELVYINPTATAIYASYMFDYAGGIYDDSRCCEAVYDGSCDINHGVAVIGYGSEGGKDYWLIKNSWGTSWGENGFLRSAMRSRERFLLNEKYFQDEERNRTLRSRDRQGPAAVLRCCLTLQTDVLFYKYILTCQGPRYIFIKL